MTTINIDINDDTGTSSLTSLPQTLVTSPVISPVTSASAKPTVKTLSVIEKKKRDFQECKKDLIQNLRDIRNDIEVQINDKEKEYEIHQQNVSKMIELQAETMSSIISKISGAEDEIAKSDKEFESIGKQICDYELEIERLKNIQRKLTLKTQENSSQIKNLEGQKKILENKSNSKLGTAKKQGEDLLKTIKLLKEDFKENFKSIEELEKHDKTDLTEDNHVPDNTNSIMDFLSKSIKDKEADLECPVCLETAEIPIYMCHQMHLICSKCRPKLEFCPECREKYQDMRRHRYAEKTAEELKELKLMANINSNTKKQAGSSSSKNS